MPFLIFLVILAVLVACLFWWYTGDTSTPIWVGVGVFILGCSLLTVNYSQTSERTVLVERKDRGGEDGSYRVYTNSDTLAVKDIWLSFNGRRFDSADLFGDILVCHRYRILVRGWEFGAFSLMPNIDRILEDLGRDSDCQPQD